MAEPGTDQHQSRIAIREAAHYSKDDPDHEEPLCHNCYERYEKMNESEE
ncbi:hypothetical protein AALB19_15710 [Oscillospiraceae bacterium 50-58]